MRHPKIVRAVALSAGLALLMTACGGDEAPGSAPDDTADDTTDDTADDPADDGAEDGDAEGEAAAEPAADECTNAEALREVEGLDEDARQQRLIELASDAGHDTVSLYSTTGPDDLEHLIEEFGNQTGFGVDVYSGSGSELLQRALQEHEAGRVGADAVVASSETMVVLTDEGAAAPAASPYADNLYEDAVHDNWYGIQFNALLLQRNSNNLSAEDAPRTFEELADFEGSIGFVFDNWDHLMTVSKHWEETQGRTQEESLEIWREITSGDVQAYTSNTPLADAVQNGELDLGLTFHHYHPRFHGRGDSPIEWEPSVEPVVFRQNGVLVPCGAPHPALGVLWQDFQTSPEAQQIFGDVLGRDVADTNIRSGVSASDEDYEIIFVDPVEVLENQDEWRGYWEDMLTGAAAP